MPATRKPQRQETKNAGNTSVKKRRRYNRALIIGLSLVLLCVVGFFIAGGVWWIFGGESTLSNQRRMETYLEEKYQKDFKVEKPRWEGSTIGNEGTLSAAAYPSDNKDIRFIISTDSSKVIWDSYPSTVWESEEKPKVEARLTEIFQKTPNFTLDLGARELEMTMSGAVPKFEDFSKIHKDKIVYRLTIDMPSTPQERAVDYTPSLIHYLSSKNTRTMLRFYFEGAKILVQPDEVVAFEKAPTTVDQFIKPLESSRR